MASWREDLYQWYKSGKFLANMTFSTEVQKVKESKSKTELNIIPLQSPIEWLSNKCKDFTKNILGK